MELFAVEILLLSIGAAFVQRITGFGFGIFIMTVLPMLMHSVGEATTLSGILALSTNLITVAQMWRYVTWHRLIPILTTFILVSTCAIFMLGRMDYRALNILLGLTLIGVSFYFTFFSQRIKVKPTISTQVVAGSISGLMGGFSGMQGPPAVLYFVNSEPDKEHYIAMMQTYFLIGNFVMTLTRAYNGFLTAPVTNGYFWGIGGVVIGNLLGTYVFRHLTGSLLRYIIYAYIGISGVLFLFR